MINSARILLALALTLSLAVPVAAADPVTVEGVLGALDEPVPSMACGAVYGNASYCQQPCLWFQPVCSGLEVHG